MLLFAPLTLVRPHLGMEEARRRTPKDGQIFIHPRRYVIVHVTGRIWRAPVPRAGRRRRLPERRLPPPHATAAVALRPGAPSWRPPSASSPDHNSALPRGFSQYFSKFCDFDLTLPAP